MERFDISEDAVFDLHPSQSILIKSPNGEYVKREDVIKLLEQIANHTDIPPKAAVIKHIDEVL